MAEAVGKNRARFTIEEVGQAVGVAGAGAGQIEGIVTDSRQVEGGNLFVALKGERFDGNEFLEQALEKGASVVGTRLAVSSQNADSSTGAPQAVSLQVPDTLQALGDLARFHRRRFQVPIVAVTGSYGKTSTRAFIHAALSAKFNTLTSQGNFNNEIGLPMTLFQLEEGHEAAVLEMGMRGLGQIEYLANIAEPTVGVITNIGPQHIELLGSEENIARAKSEILPGLPPDGLAVLPADSPFFDFLKSRAPCRVVTFGTSERADYRVQHIATNSSGNVEFTLHTPQSAHHSLQLPVPGAHNAHNAAAAFAVAHELGVEAAAIVRALAESQLPGARMRVVRLADGVTILDDCYNAGPDSTRAALQTLLDWPGSGRRVAVLGAMKELGEHSEFQHQKIGALAGTVCDVLIGVGGETRPLLNSAVASAKQNEVELQTFYCDDANNATERVGAEVQRGDVVLVKGSRSVGLEVVVEQLTAQLMAQPTAQPTASPTGHRPA